MSEEVVEKLMKVTQSQAEGELETIELKGKSYVQVHKRVESFWKWVYENDFKVKILGKPSYNDRFVYYTAKIIIFKNKEVLYTVSGHAMKEFEMDALEKAQTKAVGRALGFLGFAISESLSTAEDIPT